MKSNGMLGYLRQLSPIDAAGLAVAGLFATVFFFGVALPLSEQNQQMAAQVETAVRQQQRLNETAAKVRATRIEIDQAKASIAASTLHVLPQTALNQRLAALVELAGECGVKIDDLKPGTLVHGVKFAAIPITLTGRGGYADSCKLLHLLHERFTDVGVSAFRLAGTPAQPGSVGTAVFELQWLTTPSDGDGQMAVSSVQ